MADHVAVNETIWPSQNDIAQTAGQGKNLLENQWAKPVGALGVNNLTLTGFTVPASDVDLTIDVAAGTAYIAGRHITVPAATAVTAAASNTNHVFLKLTRDGSQLATGVSFEVNTTGTPPADSIYLCTLTTDADNITATADKRILPTTITVLNSGTSWIVPAGITQVYVEVIGASGGGGGGGETGAFNGGAGGAGGTTSFDVLTTTGGAGGFGGTGGSVLAVGSAGVAHGVGSGGTLNRTGGGQSAGYGGEGGSGTTLNGLNGGDGGVGGYVAGYLTVAPGASITYAIGAAGSAGAGGTGGGGDDGGAGRAGLAGMIVIRY